MSHSLIRLFIEDRLKTWADAEGHPSVFENVDYKPDTGRLYLRGFLLPARTQSEDLEGRHRALSGLYQITIRAPTGQGPGDAQDVAEALCQLFPNNLRLSNGTFTVILTTPASIGPGVDDDTRYVLPVSFRYRSDELT